MEYTKQNFYTGQKLLASHLNHIEDGIANIRIDASLTNADQAADAKAVGDTINKLTTKIDKNTENVNKNTKSVTSLNQSVSQLKDDVTKLKEKKAEIDDAAVSEDATWSSKHIIDMLCSPLEESGNPVVCYPVAGYPLGVKAKWEPVQEGSGTPSPENIRPIKGRKSVTVTRCGENLLDEARFPIIKTQNNIKTTSEMTLPAGTYTVCVLSVATGVYARGADVDYTYNSNKHTFTLARQTAIRLDAYWSKGRPENDENIWLVEGNEWRPYTPYIGSTTTLTPPETVYGGEVDAVSGEGQKTWKALTLDGTEAWFATNAYYAFFGNEAASKRIYGYCSHLPYIDDAGKKCAFVNTNGAVVIFGYNADYTLEEFKAYLAAQYAAGTPVQVCYKLAEPVPFTATGAQPIPALAGVNTVLTDADRATVTGRADPIKRITDLEDAVASQT